MADLPPEKYPRTEGVYAEFIQACTGGPTPGSDFVGHAGPLSEMVLLGNLAVRAARTLELDPASGEVVSPTILEEYIRPVYREGWAW